MCDFESTVTHILLLRLMALRSQTQVHGNLTRTALLLSSASCSRELYNGLIRPRPSPSRPAAIRARAPTAQVEGDFANWREDVGQRGAAGGRIGRSAPLVGPLVNVVHLVPTTGRDSHGGNTGG